jgi:hypothetical protein
MNYIGKRIIRIFNLVAESARITMLVLRKICMTKEGLAGDATFLVAKMRKGLAR